MASEVNVRVGREISEADRKSIDRNKMAVLHPLPPDSKVEGQAFQHLAVQCPHCGAIGYAWIDPELYNSVYCSWCGGYFWA